MAQGVGGDPAEACPGTGQEVLHRELLDTSLQICPRAMSHRCSFILAVTDTPVDDLALSVPLSLADFERPSLHLDSHSSLKVVDQQHVDLKWAPLIDQIKTRDDQPTVPQRRLEGPDDPAF